jgi:choline dehydrogenase-like flavoprotein
MSKTPDAGVCDKFGRTWDVPNLFVMDGSVMPTQGSANPGLTIQSLAARTADYLISQNEAVFTGHGRDMTEPPCRKSLAPPGTFTRGIPHLR